MRTLETGGFKAMRAMIDRLGAAAEHEQYIGSALKPDRSPFHLTTLLSPTGASPDLRWWGSFFAPFGIGDVLGTVESRPETGDFVTLAVKAQLRVNNDDLVVAEWEVIGSQITKVNKAALVKTVKILKWGPHQEADIRRCVALHAPQRVFGEPRAIVAMQCGVAAACLIEAIC